MKNLKISSIILSMKLMLISKKNNKILQGRSIIEIDIQKKNKKVQTIEVEENQDNYLEKFYLKYIMLQKPNKKY